MKRLALVLPLAVTAPSRARRGPAPGTSTCSRTFGRRLAKVKAADHVPILLPRTLPLGGRYKLYSRGSGARTSYVLSLEGAPNCLGANACFVATFAGKRGGKLPGTAERAPRLRRPGDLPAVQLRRLLLAELLLVHAPRRALQLAGEGPAEGRAHGHDPDGERGDRRRPALT